MPKQARTESRSRKPRRTKATLKIEQLIGAEFPGVSAYRYNSASIRVRVVDKRFKGLSLVQREDMVLPLVRKLPEDIQCDVTVLLLLAPGEQKTSMMNLEFEHPSPTML